MARPIRLIATDLDGTLEGHGCAITRYQDFAERLDRYKQRYGAEWVVCTGRSLHSFESVLKPLKTLGIEPEYVIVHHAYIYSRGHGGYWPHMLWNAGIRFQVWSSSLYLRGALNEWHRMVRGMNDHVTTVFHRRNRLCLRFRTEEAAAAAAALLREKAAVFKLLRVFHYMLEVDVRTVPYTKGMALSELAQRLGIRNAEILAIGNGHNDISMLDGEAAGAMGCPVNAEVDVMETVSRSGGHVAQSRGLEGVIEILDAWLDDTVKSELPAWWTPNKQQKNPKSMGRRMNHPGQHQQAPSPRMALWLGVLAGYTVLVVFASFGVVPSSISGLVMKPFTLVARLVEWVMQALGL
jgi:HAD superfamily hydrolase (TIGR01484 family)